MNKWLVRITGLFFIVGILLMLIAKVPPKTLSTFGIVFIVVGVLLTAFMLYKSFKK